MSTNISAPDADGHRPVPDTVTTPSGRVKYADIAAAVGVSKTTVSRALTNHAEVSEATRQKVLEAARTLGYRHDPALSSLMRYRWPGGRSTGVATIAYVYPQHTQAEHRAQKREFIPLIYDGARNEAEHLGYGLQEFWLQDYDHHRDLDDILMHRGIRGAVIAPLNIHRTLDLDFSNLAHCMVFGDDRYPQLNTVNLDWLAAVRLCVTQALSRGYCRVGFCLYNHRDPYIDRRIIAGCLAQRFELERDVGPQPSVFPYEDGQLTDRFRRWFDAERPDVVTYVNVHPFYWLKALGLSSPGDIGQMMVRRAFVGDASMVSGADPLPHQQGALAVRMVHHQLLHNEHGPRTHPYSHLSPCGWYEGETLRAVSSGGVME